MFPRGGKNTRETIHLKLLRIYLRVYLDQKKQKGGLGGRAIYITMIKPRKISNAKVDPAQRASGI